MSDLLANQVIEEVADDPDLFYYRYESDDNHLLDKTYELIDLYISGHDNTDEKLDSDMFFNCEQL